jgi:hypothetical protein
MLVRCVPTLLTVRAYLRFAKGKPASALPALAVTFGAFVGIAALAAWQLVPLSACALVCVLGARTAWLLSPLAPAWSPRRIGLMEAIVGLVYLTALAAAYGAR